MSSHHMLIVDDDQTVQILLRAYFTGKGFRCSVASDGNEALKVIDASTVHLLITDLQMPGMDGLTLLRHVRERGVITRSIVVTSYTTLGNMTECLRQGAVALVPKTLGDLTLLAKAVKQADAQITAWSEQLQSIVNMRGTTSSTPTDPCDKKGSHG